MHSSGTENDDEKFYDRLYNSHLKKLQDLEREHMKNKERADIKELEECTFKPQLNVLSKEVFDNKLNEKDAKIYEQTVMRMRNGILENFKKKYLAERYLKILIIKCIYLFRVTTGENWEKVKNSWIKPFNITDLRPKDKESVIENQDEEYFSIQITIPNGKERVLRVSRNDDPEEIAANFCKVYGLKQEIKSRLTKTITHFVNLYLKKDNEESTINNQLQDDQEDASYQYPQNSDDNQD